MRWYDRQRRDLPWRVTKNTVRLIRPDPYHVLVSEAMLQQTQVMTVIPYFLRFIKKFPTVESLASATEQDVLRLWQGLGYYSRARNLHSAARKICGDHGGVVPAEVSQLLKLPGIGRYTAGAIASIAFDRRAPVLDGNVCRVLCRIDAITGDPRETEIREKLWQRAEEILPNVRIGDFNSALMELGATICTPRNPRCPVCPVRNFCRAFAAGIQTQIPPPRKAKPSPLVQRRVFCIHHRQRWLIEQRPAKGRWAGLWQFVTVPRGQAPQLSKLSPPRRIGSTSHALTHRRYRFDIYTCEMRRRIKLPAHPPRAWVSLGELADYPLPRPHLVIAQMLENLKPSREIRATARRPTAET